MSALALVVDDTSTPAAPVEQKVRPRAQTIFDRLGLKPEPEWGGAISLEQLVAHQELLRSPAMLVEHAIAEGSLTMVVAPPKLGKTTWVGDLVCAVSRGGVHYGGTVKAGRVLWCSFEESLKRIVSRLSEGKANIKNVGVKRHWEAKDKLGQLRALIAAQAEKPSLIVIDTLGSLAGGEVRGNEDAMGAIVNELAGIAQNLEIAIVVIHHAGKGGQYLGHTSIFANVDVMASMTEDPKRPDVRVVRYAGRVDCLNEEPAYFRRDPRTKLFEYLGAKATPTAPASATLDRVLAEAEEHEQRVLDAISMKPGLGLLAVRQAVGMGVTKTDPALKRLLARGAVVKRGKGHGGYYLAAEDEQQPNFDHLDGWNGAA